MKTLTRDLTLFVSNSSKMRIALFIITLGMFVLSAGAPDATGGIGMK
jgi:hypothetical protein